MASVRPGRAESGLYPESVGLARPLGAELTVHAARHRLRNQVSASLGCSRLRGGGCFGSAGGLGSAATGRFGSTRNHLSSRRSGYANGATAVRRAGSACSRWGSSGDRGPRAASACRGPRVARRGCCAVCRAAQSYAPARVGGPGSRFAAGAAVLPRIRCTSVSAHFRRLTSSCFEVVIASVNRGQSAPYRD